MHSCAVHMDGEVAVGHGRAIRMFDIIIRPLRLHKSLCCRLIESATIYVKADRNKSRTNSIKQIPWVVLIFIVVLTLESVGQ